MNFSIKDFEALSFDQMFSDLEVYWKLYPDFENTTIPKEFHDNFNIKFINVETKGENEESHIGILPNVVNYFPTLIFEWTINKREISIPTHRVLEVDMKDDQIFIQFMPHNEHPIKNLPMIENCAWGVIQIIGKSETTNELLKILIDILYAGKETPRPRCEYCQGLLGIEQLAIEISKDNISEDAFVCSDCINGCAKNIDQINAYWSEYQKTGFIQNSAQFTTITENGLYLAQGQKNSILEIFFKIHQIIPALLNQETEISLEIQKKYKEIANYIEKFPNAEIIPYFERLDSLYKKREEQQNLEKKGEVIDKIKSIAEPPVGIDIVSQNAHEAHPKSEEVQIEKEAIPTPIEEAIPTPNEEAIPTPNEEAKEELSEDDLVENAILKLQEAKVYQEKKQYQKAIDLIYAAAEPLVEAGIWGEEELILAQTQVAEMKQRIEADKPQIPEVEQIEDIQQPPIEDSKSMKPPVVSHSPTEKSQNKSDSIEENKNLPLTPPKIEIPSEILDDEQKNKKSIASATVNLPKISVSPLPKVKQSELPPIDAKKSPELQPIQKIEIKDIPKDAGKIKFELPDAIPIDEDAQALGDALEFEPTADDIKPPEKSKPLEKIEIPSSSTLKVEKAKKETPPQEEVQEESKLSSLGIPITKKFTTPPVQPAEENLFTTLTSKEKEEQSSESKESKLEKKPLSLFEQKAKRGLFFGTEKTTSEDSQSGTKLKEDSKKMFNLFKNESSNEAPSSTANLKNQNQVNQDKPDKKTTERKQKTRSTRKKSVEFCPMCGKVADKCTCGFMKKN